MPPDGLVEERTIIVDMSQDETTDPTVEFTLDESDLARLEQDLATIEQLLESLDELAGQQADDILRSLT